MLVRMSAYTNEGTERQIMPGDVIAGGESILAGLFTTTAVSIVVPAAEIAGGITVIGSTAAIAATSATFDSAWNIIQALMGNTPNLSVVPGQTFRCLVINTLTAALTLSYGSGCFVGVMVGSGLLGTANGISAGAITVAANSNRELLATILNASAPFAVNCTFPTTSTTLNFVFPPNQTAYSMSPIATPQITVGMQILNAPTGYTASNISVVGVTQANNGITGVTVSLAGTATAQLGGGAQFIFGPSIRFDSLRFSAN